jgi:hypothetical protein
MRRRGTTPNEKEYTRNEQDRGREDDQQSTVEQRAKETVTAVSGRTTPCCLIGESRA